MDTSKRPRKLTAIEMLMMERGSPLREARASSLDVAPEHELESDRNSGQYSRPTSLHVHYTVDDIERMAKEIFEGIIPAVHLSLLGYWICESNQHYELAKGFIRELYLDQGYNVSRIKNESLRALLISTKAARPVEVRDKVIALPLQLREQRARTIHEREMASPTSTPTKDYPPNTPDRPAPLSVRSRHSGKSSKTPSTGYRSVSAPTTQNNRTDTTPLPRNTHILEDTASHPLLGSPSPLSMDFSDHVDADDVFGMYEREAPRNAEPVSPVHVFDESRLRTLNQLQGTAEVSYQYQQRIYELSRSELSSRTSDEAADGLRLLHIDEEVAETTLTQHTQSLENDNLGTAHGHQAGPVEDSAISDDDSSHHADNYASSNAASDPFEYDQGTSRRRDTELPRLKLKGRRPNTETDSYLRPLPLRSLKSREADRAPGPSPRSPPLPLRNQESKTHLTSPTIPNSPSRIPRLKAAGNMVRGHRPTKLTVPSFRTPLCSNRHAWGNTPHQQSPLSCTQVARRSPQPGQTSVRTPIAEFSAPSVDEPANRTSISGMLNKFPTPPAQSAVVNSAENIAPISLVAKACRTSTMTPATLRELLEKTRAHGVTFPVMDWASMSAPERSWRENNGMLLVSIYGRQDTELSDEDVAYVDSIAKQLATEEGKWLFDIFTDEAEIF